MVKVQEQSSITFNWRVFLGGLVFGAVLFATDRGNGSFPIDQSTVN